MATYGRSFRLSNPGSHGLGAPATGGGDKQTYTNEVGFASYYEICSMIKNKGLTIVKDNTAKAPYGFQGKYWVGFDNEASLVYKVDTLIKGKLQ